MRLENHIAFPFLTSENFILDYLIDVYKINKISDLEALHPDYMHVGASSGDLAKQSWDLLKPAGNRSYLITSTVMDKLDMLKIKRKENGEFDWSVFFHIPNRKVTFILPDQKALRIKFYDGVICFMLLDYTPSAEDKLRGRTNWVQFYIDKEADELCTHWQHSDVRQVEEFIYKLLCFIYLSDNEEETLRPGESRGTKKTGKIINSLPFQLTIVNSKWNVTSIRTEGFPVIGHFAIRWTGEGRQIPRMVFIEPFQKEGYIRRAKNETAQ